MKTKFLCLLLGIMMMLAVLTGCSDDGTSLDDIANETVRETQTLVVYLMSETEVSEQTTAEIEEAINRLTKSKYKTQLDLHFFTEDEYYQAIEKKFKGKEKEIKKAERELAERRKREKEIRESCKAAGISYVASTTAKAETVITEAQTLVNQEYGTIEYVYPEPGENQLDFFYLGGYDKYIEYRDNEWIAALDEELVTSSKKLEEHIPGIYMNNLNRNKEGVYGIPNSNVVGSYTWMLLDKELMDEFSFAEDDIQDFFTTGNVENLYRYLNDVNQAHPEITTVAGTPEVGNVYYWSIDGENNRLTNKPSVLGFSFNNNIKLGKGSFPTVDSIFYNKRYQEQVVAIKELEVRGYMDEYVEPFTQKAAVTFVKGGYDIYAENAYDKVNNPDGKYYVKMLETPRAGVEDIFQHMFCVNQLEDNVARCMEIITYINTNSEARNIMQYGVEGENYYIDDDGVLHRYNQTYMMDINKTGNVFMAHPEEGLAADYWNYGIKQNADALIDPLYNLDLGYDQVVDSEAITRLQDLYDEYIERMNACTTVEELNSFFKTANAELMQNEDYNFVLKKAYEPKTDEDPVPFGTIYWNWIVSNGWNIE